MSENQTQAQPGSDIALLPPAERAVIVLDSTKIEARLRELVTASADIKKVVDGNGRDEAHRAGMALRNARTSITKTGKAARDDATAFCTAVIAEEKRLISITKAEEDRVLALRDAYDEKVKAEKEEADRKERERVAGIKARIDQLRALPANSRDDNIEDMRATLADLQDFDVKAGEFAEFEIDAAEAVANAIAEMSALIDRTQAAIDAAAKAAEERAEAERKRKAAEEDAARAAEAQRKAEAEAAALRAELEAMRAQQAAKELPAPVADPAPVVAEQDDAPASSLETPLEPAGFTADEVQPEPEAPSQPEQVSYPAHIVAIGVNTGLQFLALARKAKAAGFAEFAGQLEIVGWQLKKGELNERLVQTDLIELYGADSDLVNAARDEMDALDEHLGVDE